ncbi:MAG: SRPBCC family protein [Rhizomicrobium sp.]
MAPGNTGFRNLLIGAAIALPLIFAKPGHAEVLDVTANGFSSVTTVHIAAPPDTVYGAITEPGKWWSSAHSFSGDARNMTFDPRAGGCWCESLPGGGSVQILVVVLAAPGKVLRLRGAMGPIQATGADGAFTWTLKPAADGTDVTFNIELGGCVKGGFATLARLGHSVSGDQLARLKAFVETGKGN